MSDHREHEIRRLRTDMAELGASQADIEAAVERADEKWGRWKEMGHQCPDCGRPMRQWRDLTGDWYRYCLVHGGGFSETEADAMIADGYREMLDKRETV